MLVSNYVKSDLSEKEVIMFNGRMHYLREHISISLNSAPSHYPVITDSLTDILPEPIESNP